MRLRAAPLFSNLSVCFAFIARLAGSGRASVASAQVLLRIRLSWRCGAAATPGYWTSRRAGVAA